MNLKHTLHLEGVAIAAACTYLYAQSGGGWALFTVLLIAPDIMMLGYLAGSRIGAVLYNLGHSYTCPALLGCFALSTDTQTPSLVALIWGAHIGIDRALGYGLKYATAFKDTHLGRV